VPPTAFDFFLRLNERVAELRHRHRQLVPGHIVCRACAYMQLDPDCDPTG
jgi:hypothetical protein